jgi:hypothetical protein
MEALRRADYHSLVTAPTGMSRDVSRRSALALRSVFLSGLLLALPGGLLPLWGYHIQTDFARAGDYFLSLAMGLAAGALSAQRYGGRRAPSRIRWCASFVAAGAIVLLAFAAPPAGFWWGFAGLFLASACAGALNTRTFQTIGPAWQADPAGVTLKCGTTFALGSALGSVFLAWCFEGANPGRTVVMLAIVPALAGASMLFRLRDTAGVFEPAARPPRETELWTVLAFAFGLLLFFQFAAEWSIAGWLPIILIDRLGISPRSAVDLLALYWFALAAGRLGASRLISHVRQGFLLAGSAFCALFGCAAILAAGNRFGMVTGMLLAGMGLSAIYPLASAKISTRFSSYHPGYFNGMFTFALLGGMLMPFVLGHAAAHFGLGIVPLAAMIGSCAVLLLLILISLGRLVSGN